MSSGFEKMEEGQDAKLKHDSEVQFRIEARRNKLLGLWAAGRMSLEGDAADAYAMDVVKEDIKEPGVEDVLSKIRTDLGASGVEFDDAMIGSKLEECERMAIEQLKEEGYGST